MRIGIFGGSFDPVHLAHIEMGLQAKKELFLDKLFLVPTRPWQKTARASDAQRLEMLKIAVKNLDNTINIDTRELDRAGQSYSIDTIFSFRKEYGPHSVLFFIMGADQWKNLTTWIQWKRFPELTNLAVFKRNGIPFENPYKAQYPILPAQGSTQASPAGSIYILDAQEINISSTEIRQALFQEPSRSLEIKGLVPEVHNFILQNKLYLPRGGSHRI